jgi:chorismate lyase / 3-hydroxybenzoate synthase
MPNLAAVPRAFSFVVEFGGRSSRVVSDDASMGLALPLPLLGGEAREAIFPETGFANERSGLRVLDSGDLRIGWVSEPVKNARTLSAQTEALYQRMLAAAEGRHLYRVWNYVPHINALTDNFENYRAFCQGRSLGYEAVLGTAFPRVLPAASAVGTDDEFLSVIFACGRAVPRHVENPEQVPAYFYPAEHGPRAPSFSRATVVDVSGGHFTFISGTSAIKGHVTIAPDALLDQLDCTIDNLRLISKEAGAGDNLGAGQSKARHFKIYLRHAADFAATRARLEEALILPTDRVTYLQSDICRAALRVEIEATLLG